MLVMLVLFRDTMLNSNNRSDTFDNYWRIIKTMNQRELFHPKNKYFHLIHLEKEYNSSYRNVQQENMEHLMASYEFNL